MLSIYGDDLVGFHPMRLGLPAGVGQAQVARIHRYAPSEAGPLRAGDRTDDHGAESRPVQRVRGDDQAWTHTLLLTPFLGVEVEHPDLTPQRLWTLHGEPPSRPHSIGPPENAPRRLSRSSMSSPVTSAAASLNILSSS